MADINALDQKNTQSKLDSLLTAAFNLTGVNITNIAAEQTAYTVKEIPIIIIVFTFSRV